MFIDLKHKSLYVYQTTCELVKETYLIALELPVEEKFNMSQQLRRAALSVKLNLAEGATRKSFAERNRYYEMARGSLVEVDAIMETAVDLNFLKPEKLEQESLLLNKCFALISGLIKKENEK